MQYNINIILIIIIVNNLTAIHIKRVTLQQKNLRMIKHICSEYKVFFKSFKALIKIS